MIGTGGTISGVSDTRVSFQTYKSGQMKIADMVDYLQPEIGKVADVSTVQFGNKGSSGYAIKDYYALTKEVDKQLDQADAVVVTTGTDTMEEFAYWLDLTVRSSKPVVLTSAMRPWTVIGTDAPANLYNAIVLAASGKTTCNGAVIMLNDEIQAARDVTKTNGLRMETRLGSCCCSRSPRPATSTPSGVVLHLRRAAVLDELTLAPATRPVPPCQPSVEPGRRACSSTSLAARTP